LAGAGIQIKKSEILTNFEASSENFACRIAGDLRGRIGSLQPIPRLAIVPRTPWEHGLWVAHTQEAKSLWWSGFFDLITALLTPALAELFGADAALSSGDKLPHQ